MPFGQSVFKFTNLTVTKSKTSTQSTTEKPGKGKLKVNTTVIAPKKEGERIIKNKNKNT